MGSFFETGISWIKPLLVSRYFNRYGMNRPFLHAFRRAIGLIPEGIPQLQIMRYLYILAVLLSFGASAQKQQEAVPVRILDASQVYANYRWSLDNPAREMLLACMSDSLSTVIFQKTQEGQWPDGFKSVQDREENRGYFCDLKAFLLCPLSAGKVLLFIPSAGNRHLPLHLQSREDWYLVIRERAIERLGATFVFPDALGAQVAFLLDDFIGGYAKSMVQGDSGPLLTLDGQITGARFVLEGARSSIFLRSPSASQMTFLSIFPSVPERADALRQYRDILQRLSSTLFRNCPMAKQKEQALGNGALQTAFIAFDYSGDMDPRCRGLHIEIQLLPSFAQSGTRPVWYVQLSIVPG